MAWNELVDKRGRGSKLFQDSADPLKHAVDAQAGTRWHYDSAPDAGDLANEVDLTPERVLAGGHDGWRVTNNGWHYFLGQPNGLADGFVGFGGRQGNRWLLFRLARVGYLHWPTRAWDDIGGAPSYNRANLSQQTNETIVNTTGQTIPVEAAAEWSDLWNTPGGGALDVSWRADGNRLKEEITINDAGRTWIAANHPPATPASETYFSFVFRLGSAPDVNNIQMDLSYLAKWLKNGIEQDTEGDFDDDDGTVGIEVQNALDEFLFFLPISEAYVDEEQPDGSIERTSIKLRKRIYKDGSDYYLLVGAKVSDLAGLPSGDLVFDPTVDAQVGASGDDGFWNSGGYLKATNGRYLRCGIDDLSRRYYQWWRFTGYSDLEGATIDVAYNETYADGGSGDWLTALMAEDAASPDAPSSASDAESRVVTTAKIDWDGSGSLGSTFVNSPSIVSVIQELVDDYDPTVIQIFWKDDGSTDDASLNVAQNRHYDDAAPNAPKLHIEYTAAAGGEDYTVSVIMHHRRLIGAS